MTDSTTPEAGMRIAETDLIRPIVGIENRTPREVFDIMADRIDRHFAAAPAPPAGGEGEPAWLKSRDPFFIEGWRAALAARAHPTVAPAARDGGEAAVQYEVWLGDMLVASSDILSDAQHFAMIYGQDGPLDVIVATTYRVALAAGGEK